MAQPVFPRKPKPMKLKLKVFALTIDTDVSHEILLYSTERSRESIMVALMEDADPGRNISDLIESGRVKEAWDLWTEAQSKAGNYYRTHEDDLISTCLRL